jgi:orotate phosphoribosyltransferase
MLSQEEVANQVANYLLQIKAIKLNPQNPYTWASGWKSPIYCDNRIILSYPKIRTFIKEQLADSIHRHFRKVKFNKIAGVATAGIAHGALVADYLNMPFVYVRPRRKSHGLKNLIEGEINEGDRVIVIEDLISTGKSSAATIQALKKSKAKVIGVISIFTYGFDVADAEFSKLKCKYYSLTDYDKLTQFAVKNKYIKPAHIESLEAWRENPAEWAGAKAKVK